MNETSSMEAIRKYINDAGGKDIISTSGAGRDKKSIFDDIVSWTIAGMPKANLPKKKSPVRKSPGGTKSPAWRK